jgi:hypothetical protein
LESRKARTLYDLLEQLLEPLISQTQESPAMREEIERLESLARWEVVGKLSRTMSDAVRAIGSTKEIMHIVLNWYGMQEGKRIDDKKFDNLLEDSSPKIEEVREEQELD